MMMTRGVADTFTKSELDIALMISRGKEKVGRTPIPWGLPYSSGYNSHDENNQIL